MALLKRKRSGLSDPMSVVTRFVNACNRHDADSVGACLHPEFDSIQPMFPSRNFRGADQVRRNWQAIFDAEPGFRLTVLRQAAADDTVWLELHGAGRDAEVAGVFVMGIQGDRIRWARIYSALIEPLPEGVAGAAPSGPATLRGVPAMEEGAPGATVTVPLTEVVVDEAVIASVVDIDGGSRSRRRRSSRRRSSGPDEAPPVAESTDQDEPVAEEESSAGMPEEPVAVTSPPPVESEPVMDDAPEVDTARRLLEEREPEVVPEPTAAEPTAAEPTTAVPTAAEPTTAEPTTAEPTTGEPTAAEPEHVVVSEAPADAESDDIVWAELTPEAPEEVDTGPDSGPDPDAEPTRSVGRPGDQGRPGKRRGRKKR